MAGKASRRAIWTPTAAGPIIFSGDQSAMPLELIRARAAVDEHAPARVPIVTRCSRRAVTMLDSDQEFCFD